MQVWDGPSYRSEIKMNTVKKRHQTMLRLMFLEAEKAF